MKSDLNILILDDHAMIRKGIRLTIETNFSTKSISEVSGCAALLSFLKRNTVSHLILDLLLPDGNTLEIIPTIIRLYPHIRILVFSMQPQDVYAAVLKQYGITEYLHKEASEEFIIQTFNNFFLNIRKAETIAYEEGAHSCNPFSKLTARELEVLHYLLKGTGTKDISDKLCLQMSTVSTLKFRIFEKTSTGNIKELIDSALLYNISS
jgi:DNA-binding NarL/FixJ family response regulator